MFKSKVCVLTFFLLMMIISSVCFADSRWFVVQEDSQGSIFLDTTRVSTYKNERNIYLDCWLKKNKNEGNVISLEHTYINANTLSYKIAERTIYQGKKYIGAKDRSDQGWESPTPGSRQEIAILGSIDWAINNKEKVIVR